MTIRALKAKDLPELINIEETAQAVPWSEMVFTRCFEAGYPGWVKQVEKRVVGFVMASIMAGDCHILNLCIHPHFQRQGIGHALLEHALGQAKILGADMAYLEVRRSNTRAITLYKKMGFMPVGERKDYYQVPTGTEDALVFAKELR